jgi:hypothetical protein
MTISSARWLDAEQTAVTAIIDGETLSYVPLAADRLRCGWPAHRGAR